MSLIVFGVVLFAALVHASWNAVVKGGSDTLLTTALVASAASLLALIGIVFLPLPSIASWPFIVASTVLQSSYFVLLALAYRVADMSQTYPLMRGTAPLIVAIVSVVLLREPLSAAAWLGVAVICAGILSMAANVRPGQGKGVALALINAVVIAGYTLVDGVGVRISGSPVAYALWIFFLTGLPLAAWAVIARRGVLLQYARANWRQGIVGGIGASLSYGLALWAMTLAPVAVVAALRETSIVFGAAISYYILGERVTRVRVIGACVIAAGAIALRLA
jgi:drug/metabolite transporter (DMT)-like permease